MAIPTEDFRCAPQSLSANGKEVHAIVTFLHTFKFRQSAIQRPNVLLEPRKPKADVTSFLHAFRELKVLFYTQFRVRKC